MTNRARSAGFLFRLQKSKKSKKKRKTENMCCAKATKLPVEHNNTDVCRGRTAHLMPTSAAMKKRKETNRFFNFNINNAECILIVFNSAAK